MTAINRRTTVELVGRGTLTLAPNDHMATGGEGSVYLKGSTVVKIYKDPGRLGRDGLADKIKLLSTFRHPYIVAPHGLVLDAKGSPIGFYMDYTDGEPLSRVFTNDFRTRTGFNDRQASIVADRMLQVVHFAHQQSAVMVDANELNWAVELRRGNDPLPRALDVDSWSVGRWPARVIMPSIRDWHTSGFTPSTDHFAWGVVTFQLYTGLHPYKGSLAGYKANELERRMKDNASVFTPGIRLNRAVRDFGCIPGPLLQWYEATFQQGVRTPPPSPLATGTAAAVRQTRITRVITTAQGSLRYDRLYDAVDRAVRIFPCGVALLQSGSLYDLATQRRIGVAGSDTCELIRVQDGWLLGCPNPAGGKPDMTFIHAGSLESIPLELSLQAAGLLRYQNRLFATSEHGLTELSVKQFARPILTAGQTWGAMPNATRWFDGVGVQDAFGATFLIVPFGDNACTHVRVKELDGLRPVAARAGNRFVAVIAVDRTGDYHKFQFTFDRAYQTYTLWQGSADSAELNMALLPRGVMATTVRDGQLVIVVPTTSAVNRVDDKDVTTDMVLTNWADRVVFIRDGQVWTVRMSS